MWHKLKLAKPGRLVMATLLAGFWLLPASGHSQSSENSAVVFTYHRFGDDRFPETNTTIEQLEAHLQEIREGGYRVVGLKDIIAAYRSGGKLADKTIAITVDDAFLSVYQNAYPVFRRHGIPFTLFVSTEVIDRKNRDYMSWDQLREMSANGVTIGNHSHRHSHFPDLAAAQVIEEIETAAQRFEKELGFRPSLFAYPYGEFGAREKKIVASAGFLAAFGQHSGVTHPGGDQYALPRFAMNEKYGALDRFRLAANALPIPASDLTPKDAVLRDNNPPSFGFTITRDLANKKRLACFASNQDGPVKLEFMGEYRVEVRLEKPFQPPRGRINCTIPAGNGRWRWLGQQFYLPENPR